MKKIFLGIVCFVVAVSNIKALAYNDLSIKYQSNETSGVFTNLDNTCNNTRCFIFHKLPGYKITDSMKLNNLALIGTYLDDVKMLAAVQMMLLESIYPDYTFTLLNDSEEINIDNEKIRIKEMLEEYEKITPFEEEYTINYGDKLILKSDYNLKKYAINDNYSEIYNNEIIVNINKVGKNKIHLTNTLNIANGYLIYGVYPAYKEMDITVNVLGNTVVFDVGKILNNDYNFIFKLYDENDKYISTQSINKNKNEIYFKNNTKVKIVSEKNNKFLDYNDIILDNDSNHIYNIEYNRLLKKGYLNIFSYKNTNHNYLINLTIYDLFFNKIKDIEGDFIFDVELEYGNYIIYDKNKNSYDYIEVSDFTDYIVDNTIRGIISNENITKITSNNKDIKYIKNDKYYMFIDKLDISDITFTINDKEYTDNLNDKNNYLYISKFGYLYNYNLPVSNEQYSENNITIDEIKENDNKEKLEQNTFNEDIKSINVPNTYVNIDLLLVNDLYYDKKKFNIYNNYIYNFLYTN